MPGHADRWRRTAAARAGAGGRAGAIAGGAFGGGAITGATVVGALVVGALVVGAAGCGAGPSSATDAARDGAAAIDASPADARADGRLGAGHVVFMLGGRARRIEATAGASAEDLGAALDARSAGADEWVNVSPDGAWLLLGTTRFGCAAWSCVALVDAAVTGGGAVAVPGGDGLLHAGRGAVAAGGGAIVASSTDQVATGHHEDLIVTTRGAGGAWSAPVVISAASPHPYNHLPSIAADGRTVLFDCSDDAYSTSATDICEVGVDGGGLRVVVRAADRAGGGGLALHHPAYAPDGAVVFEGDWLGEQIWRRAGAAAPVDLSADAHDDNSPCVLPDGRIASLWLGRAGGPSTHELKLMNADGSGAFVLLANVDVADVGLGCGP